MRTLIAILTDRGDTRRPVEPNPTRQNPDTLSPGDSGTQAEATGSKGDVGRLGYRQVIEPRNLEAGDLVAGLPVEKPEIPKRGNRVRLGENRLVQLPKGAKANFFSIGQLCPFT